MYSNKDYLVKDMQGVPSEQAEGDRNWIVLGLYASGTEEEPLIKVEGMSPMAPDAFAKWLWHASKKVLPPARPLARDPKNVWVAEKQTKEELARMSKWREEWNKVKRKYPTKSKKEIDEIVRDKIKSKEQFEKDWKVALEESLDGFLAGL